MKHRLKQFFKVSIALIAVLIGVAGFLSWRSYAEVEAALKPIRDRGEPVSLANLRTAAVAEDENAATYLKPIAAEVEQVVNEAYPIAYPDDFSWRHGLAEGQIATLRQIFDAHPHLPDQLALASHCNSLAWPLDFESSPNELMGQVMQVSQQVRAIARLQVIRTRYLAAIGKPDDAVAVCLEELRLVRLQADTPLLVSWMVNMACRREVLFQLNGILQTETLTPQTHAEIERELAQQQLASDFTQTLKSERAFGIESFRGFSILAASLTPQLANYIEYMNEQIETSSRAPNEPASTKVTAVGMTTLLVPAIDNARDAMKHTLATERCLRILNAIQSRQEPASAVDLHDLGLPAEAIRDPYSGETLLAQSAESGWIVYSVGENGSDDDGQIEPDSVTNKSADIGVGPPSE
ncbi:hypothetical protein [Novipirellula sp.]|uniref:hypothetical protein n=1 Tax=Novipirellula sp. TaxID=2795430 RepID=UPI003561FA28